MSHFYAPAVQGYRYFLYDWEMTILLEFFFIKIKIKISIKSNRYSHKSLLMK